MRALYLASECVPYSKTGGLGDVAGALLRHLGTRRDDMRFMSPLYRGIREAFNPVHDCSFSVSMGGAEYLVEVYRHGERAYFIHCGNLFDRDGLYGENGADYADNALRFALFSRAAIEYCINQGFAPDIFHLNDWQTALVPVLLKSIYRERFAESKTVLTVHNIGYQGRFEPSVLSTIGLPIEFFSTEMLEFYGDISFLKGGLLFADAITTVSVTHAQELLDPVYAKGMEGVLGLRRAALSGILNGLDMELWNPWTDTMIPSRYGPNSLRGKNACRRELLKRACIKSRKMPVLGMVGRLAQQKGIDIVIGAMEEILSNGVSVVVLGTGEPEIQESLSEMAARNKGRLGFLNTYDEKLAHLVYAGSDMFMMPSHYEPCGLAQMIAMRYGAIPVARRTGGLADTIDDYNRARNSGNGFLFTDYSADALAQCVKRAAGLFDRPGLWREMVLRAMQEDFSWTSPARKYMALYRGLIGESAP